MGGTFLAAPRWARDPQYRDRFFRGRTIDYGGGSDSLGLYRAQLPNITHLTVIDRDQPGAAGVDCFVPFDLERFDFGPWAADTIYSSHTLEHLTDEAEKAFWRALPVALTDGGHAVIIVPDWHCYEREMWPSAHNADHRGIYTLNRFMHGGLLPVRFPHLHDGRGLFLVSALLLDAGFDPNNPHDQTGPGTCECGIEVIYRKGQP